HVINDRAKDRNCTDGVINETTLTPEARGTSECVIIGKYTTIKDGTVVTSSTVVGELKAGKSIDTANNDLEALQMYNLGISAVDNETSPVAWSATVFEPNVSDPANVAILLLRSPLTGSIRTFVGPIPAENVSVATLVDQQNTAEKKLCIESGSPLAGPRLGVLIKANAAGSSAIELLGDDGGC
ncbi:MAG: hypothetical protein ABJA64_03050, partial [Candidatus Saccharibacteria bacterium]